MSNSNVEALKHRIADTEAQLARCDSAWVQQSLRAQITLLRNSLKREIEKESK